MKTIDDHIRIMREKQAALVKACASGVGDTEKLSVERNVIAVVVALKLCDEVERLRKLIGKEPAE